MIRQERRAIVVFESSQSRVRVRVWLRYQGELLRIGQYMGERDVCTRYNMNKWSHTIVKLWFNVLHDRCVLPYRCIADYRGFRTSADALSNHLLQYWRTQVKPNNSKTLPEKEESSKGLSGQFTFWRTMRPALFSIGMLGYRVSGRCRLPRDRASRTQDEHQLTHLGCFTFSMEQRKQPYPCQVETCRACEVKSAYKYMIPIQ